MYAWDITPMVQGWCMNPATNFGVLLGGQAGAGVVNFHSNDGPPALRPTLTYTY